MLLDWSPLREFPLYRRLFLAQLVSFFGSQITYVALPFQLYALTGSTLKVGLLGLFQLAPLLLVGPMGGAVADRFDRRQVCLMSEALLALLNLLLILLNTTESINESWIYAIGAVGSGLNAFHRPAFSSLVPQVVTREAMPRVSPLNSFPTSFGMITGPAVGGLLIAGLGIQWTYAVDFLTYVFAMVMMFSLPKLPALHAAQNRISWSMIREGLSYACSRKDLLGTYLVDIFAMTLAFPNPLFPLLAKSGTGEDKLGWYYSAIACGAMLATLTSRWTIRVVHHGRMIAFGASGWGLGILLFGLNIKSYFLSLAFLAFAGWSDMISGIFRQTIWNQTIPQERRGRLASIEMLSYVSGPLLGNSLMGLLADRFGPEAALSAGGSVAMVSCLALALVLKSFWNYRATPA